MARGSVHDALGRPVGPPPVDDDAAAMFQLHGCACTDADWQTITTGHANGTTPSRGRAYVHATGSSLADVFDVVGCRVCETEHGSTDKMSQCPDCHQNWFSCQHYDEGLKVESLRPLSNTYRPKRLPQHAPRGSRRPRILAAAAVRRFSSPYRREAPLRNGKVRRTFDMSTLASSYESLYSGTDARTADQISPPEGLAGPQPRFRWSRIRRSLGRQPPNPAAAIFDQPLYGAGIREAAVPGVPPHIPHDDFLSEIPRLPFPLISLPEAAMLQYFKRQRGEEDPTEAGTSFASRRRQGTFSTMSSSNGPQTPIWPNVAVAATVGAANLAKPAPAHHGNATPGSKRRPESEWARPMVLNQVLSLPGC